MVAQENYIVYILWRRYRGVRGLQPPEPKKKQRFKTNDFFFV